MRPVAATGWREQVLELARRTHLLPAGLAFAVGFACLSLTPSLLPRPPLFQGVVSGAAAASGYGFGVFVAWCWRGLRDRERQPWPRWAVLALVIGSAVALLVSLVLGVRWQDEAHRLADTEPTPVSYVLLTPLVALVVAALLLVHNGEKTPGAWIAFFAIEAVVIAVLWIISRRKTDGEWHWRWGGSQNSER